MEKVKYIWMILVLWSIVTLGGCAAAPASVSVTDFMMDTSVSVTLYGAKAEDATALMSLLRQVEKEYSPFLESSLVSRINRGETVSLSEEQLAFFTEMKQLCLGDNNFDITVGALTRLWNVTGENAVLPSAGEIAAALETVGIQHLQIEENRVFLDSAGTQLDTGGIAKGLACRRGYEWMKSRGISGILSVGGSVVTRGDKGDNRPFVIGLRDPKKSANDYFATITPGEGCMATSGVYERFFQQDGRIYHHILDPHTGSPYWGQWSSLTVMGQDGVVCDYLSTSLFFLPQEELLKAAKQWDVEVVAVKEDGTVVCTEEIREKIKITDGSYQVAQ